MTLCKSLTTREKLFFDLQQNGDPNVIFGHDAVQHDLWALRVCHGNLIKLNCVFLHQWKSMTGKKMALVKKLNVTKRSEHMERKE